MRPISSTASCRPRMIAGASGRVTSPMPSRMIFASGWAAWKAFARFAMSVEGELVFRRRWLSLILATSLSLVDRSAAILANRLGVQAQPLDVTVRPARHRERAAVGLQHDGAVAVGAVDAGIDPSEPRQRAAVGMAVGVPRAD